MGGGEGSRVARYPEAKNSFKPNANAIPFLKLLSMFS